jgi:beta-N-acetylhexosaminidase
VIGLITLFAAAIAVAGITETGPPRHLTSPAALTNDQLAGTRVITGFPGRRPPPQLRRMISAGEVSGVIVFDRNVAGRHSVRRLTAKLQAIPRPADEPLLVSVDQEGGLVRRLPGPPKLSAAEIGARGVSFAGRLGRATGRSLRTMGVNVDLAPVLDLGRPGRAIEEEDRSFARAPGAVAALGGAFASGLAAGGVAATAKHFPGLGAARINTDDAVQRIHLSAATLRRADQRPFASFADAGGGVVMLSTAIYPSLSGLPASLSHEIATGELRDRLGFDGVSITDALGTVSARAFGGPGKTATAAAAAGTDLVLFTDLGSAAKARHALAAGLRDGKLRRTEFEASAGRVLALRASLGGSRR